GNNTVLWTYFFFRRKTGVDSFRHIKILTFIFIKLFKKVLPVTFQRKIIKSKCIFSIKVVKRYFHLFYHPVFHSLVKTFVMSHLLETIRKISVNLRSSQFH